MNARRLAMFTGVVLLLLAPRLALAERLTLLVSFDSEKIGPAVALDGELLLSDGGQLTLRPWMHDGADAVDGSAFKLTSEHTAKSAAAARLAKVYHSTLPKGLIVEIDAPAGASLEGTTAIGRFEVPLARLRANRGAELLDGKARLTVIPNVTALSGDAAEEEYPSVAVLPDGRVATARVAFDGESDRIVLRVGDREQTIAEGGEYVDPRCEVDGRGKLWIVWAANDGGPWDLWAHTDGRTERLTRGGLNDFWPRLARDARGQLWLAWQTVTDQLDYEVMLARLGPDGLSDVVNVSDHQHDDWEPALCATPDGRVVVAWDTYRHGSYDVYLRQFRAVPGGSPEPLGPPLPVAATARREAHATIAADRQNRVWVAWDESFSNWGKHPEQGGTLHSERSSRVACLVGSRLQRPAADFMESLPEDLTQFVEYPLVAVDGEDRVWLIFRIQNRVEPVYTAGRRGQRYGTWHLLASQYDGRGFSEPVLLALSSGRQDMRPDAATAADGSLLVVYGADGRTRRFPYMPVDYDVGLASLAGFGAAPQSMELAAADDLGRVEEVDPDPELLPLPRTWRLGSQQYRLVLGDTHRHTDISRCQNGRDGSLQDAYRYALNAAGLDWLAISDHDQDILKHRNDRRERPRQEYDWWRSQKYCDLYTIPGRFVAVYGYEHGGSYQARGGHKNILYSTRGGPMAEVDDPVALFDLLADSGAVAIPHQLADGGSRTDWQKWSEEFERVGEIFQTRESYEYLGCPRAAASFTQGHSMWDALAAGVRIGIIASSDHTQTHQARAGVWVDDPPDKAARFTRLGILDALKARRAFGATTAVTLEVSIAGRPLGEEITLDAAPTVEARVVAPAPITQLDVVRDNRFVYTTRPEKPEAKLRFQDLDLKPGQSAYYYVRARIGTQDLAWSSPLWVTRDE